MGQKCSSGYVKVWDNNYTRSGGDDPRFGDRGSSGGGSGLDANKCVAIPIEQQNRTRIQGNPSTGLGTTNVFDTTANRLGFISPIHT